ncbi:MAG TPA: metallophosphoesterase family protein [Trichocoleus sp.]
MPRRIFIGDVHGHYDGLMRLWDAIAPDDADRVYFVGDLIDRGPKSAQVVDFVRQHAHGCVRGNHEQLLLDSFIGGNVNPSTLQGWLYSGGQATLNSYGSSAETLMNHLDWFKTLPLYLDLNDIWLVHAGVNPNLSIQDQSSYELCWIRDTFHSSEKPYFDDKLILTGHTITFTFTGIEPGQIVQGRGWLDIDTGVYHPRSGWLTALDWDNCTVYQVNVFENTVRIRPLSEAVTQVAPHQIRRRQRDPIKS